MGVSTDAILFYGHCWGEERSLPWDEHEPDDEDDGWEERYARLKGLAKPTAEYPSRRVRNESEYTPEERAVIAEWSAWFSAKNKVAKESTCVVDEHCSDSCPMPFVAITASVIRANRGYPREVESLSEEPEWDAQLKEFCALMGIEPPGEPKWWLVSYWG